jgi:hypothetical protein
MVQESLKTELAKLQDKMAATQCGHAQDAHQTAEGSHSRLNLRRTSRLERCRRMWTVTRPAKRFKAT